jgi:hypothetical protein
MSKFPATSPATAIVALESGGAGPVYTHNGSLMIERPTLQFISRSTGYATARSNAQVIYDTLAAVTNSAIPKNGSTSETTYLTISPLQSPTDMGQDSDERALVTCNYFIEKEPS